MSTVLLALYRVLMTAAVLPFCLVMRKHPNFAGTLTARLGFGKLPLPPGKSIWIHAASLGEVKAAAGLIDELHARRPDLAICLSAMTATGRQAAAAIPGVTVVLPMPFDLPWVMRRTLRALKAVALIIMETEIWPEMLLAARAAQVPAAFVNARMTAKAAARYRIIRPVTARIMAEARILAITDHDAGRFAALGAPQVEVLGNLKFDAVQHTEPGRAAALRERLGLGTRPVFIAGSVREGEEAPVMEAIHRAAAAIPGLCAIVVPRHQDRIPLLRDLAAKTGLSWALRSAMTGAEDIVIVDTVGELFTLYGLSQVAFVGGSLVDRGGQNILEPVAWGVPTLHGPSMYNFLWALNALEGFTHVVHSADELARTVIAVMKDPASAGAMAAAATATLAACRGAVVRYADRIVAGIPE